MGKVSGNWLTGAHTGRACRHEDVYTRVANSPAAPGGSDNSGSASGSEDQGSDSGSGSGDTGGLD